jgi:opacity protein-like surface antigen
MIMEMEMKMKKILVIAALAASLASPALAQSWDPDVGSGNIAPPPYGQNENGSSIYQGGHRGYSARAEAPRHFAAHRRVHAKQHQQQPAWQSRGAHDRAPCHFYDNATERTVLTASGPL